MVSWSSSSSSSSSSRRQWGGGSRRNSTRRSSSSGRTRGAAAAAAFSTYSGPTAAHTRTFVWTVFVTSRTASGDRSDAAPDAAASAMRRRQLVLGTSMSRASNAARLTVTPWPLSDSMHAAAA